MKFIFCRSESNRCVCFLSVRRRRLRLHVFFSRVQCRTVLEEYLLFRPAQESEYVYITGIDQAFSSLKNDEMFHTCIVSMVAYLSTRAEVCSLSPIRKSGLKNTEAQWIVQSGTNDARPFWDAGIKGSGQVIQVSDR